MAEIMQADDPPELPCPACDKPMGIRPHNDVYQYTCRNGGCEKFPNSGYWSTPRKAYEAWMNQDDKNSG